MAGVAVTPDTPDPKALRDEYERAGQQLRAWLWAGLSLLLLGFGLWRWGPRERLAETTPVAVRGYAFRQAGAVRGPGGTTWLWILADTAGQAQVLLSTDHGRTWRARALGVPGNRARALALGWGAPGKGLVVGDSGWVRTLADVFNNPTRGQNYQVAGLSSAALRSVAVDTLGQEAVLTEAYGDVWATLDQGRTWTLQRLSASRLIQPDAGITATYWPHRGSFLLVSSQRLGELQPASKAMEVNMRFWGGWTNGQRVDTVAALVFDFNREQEHDNILFIARGGEALYSWRIEGREPAATSHSSLRLFGPRVQAVALASWPPR